MYASLWAVFEHSVWTFQWCLMVNNLFHFEGNKVPHFKMSCENYGTSNAMEWRKCFLFMNPLKLGFKKEIGKRISSSGRNILNVPSQVFIGKKNLYIFQRWWKNRGLQEKIWKMLRWEENRWNKNQDESASSEIGSL